MFQATAKAAIISILFGFGMTALASEQIAKLECVVAGPIQISVPGHTVSGASADVRCAASGFLGQTCECRSPLFGILKGYIEGVSSGKTEKLQASHSAVEELSKWYALTPDPRVKSNIKSCLAKLEQKLIPSQPTENDYDIDEEQLAREDLKYWFRETHDQRIGLCFAELDRDALTVDGTVDVTHGTR